MQRPLNSILTTVHRGASAARSLRVGLGLFAIVAAASLLAGGCERSAPTVTISSTRPATPATLPSAALPATAPSTRPAETRMIINGQTVTFPRARLVLAQKSPSIVVRLFSDDPKEALDSGYRGNSFYFEIPLDISDPEQIPGMQATYQAASAEHVESATGIFLEGTRKHLQPFNVKVQFAQCGGEIAVEITGQFMMFRTRDAAAAPEGVWVHAIMSAELEGR